MRKYNLLLFISLLLSASISIASIPKISTYEVHKGYDNPKQVTISWDGTVFTSAEMAAITNVEIIYQDSSSIDYATCPTCFDFTTYASNSIVEIELGDVAFTAGRDSEAELIVYDSTYTNGRVVARMPLIIHDDPLVSTASVTPNSVVLQLGDLQDVDDSSATTGQYLRRDSDNTYSFFSIANYADASETDQGAAGSGETIKDLIDAAAGNPATIVLSHSDQDAQTTYSIDTNLTIPANITLIIERGAVISGVTGDEILRINGDVDAGRWQIFGADIDVLGGGTVVYPEWFGDNTVPGTTDMTAAIHAAINFCYTNNGGEVSLVANRYLVTGIELKRGVVLSGPSVNSGMTTTNFIGWTAAWGRAILEVNEPVEYVVIVDSDAYGSSLNSVTLIGREYATDTLLLDDSAGDHRSGFYARNCHFLGGINAVMHNKANHKEACFEHCFFDGDNTATNAIKHFGEDCRFFDNWAADATGTGSIFSSTARVRWLDSWGHDGIGIEWRDGRPFLSDFVCNNTGLNALKFTDCPGGIVSNGRELRNQGLLAASAIPAVMFSGDCQGLVLSNLRFAGSTNTALIDYVFDSDGYSAVNLNNISVLDDAGNSNSYDSLFSDTALAYFEIDNVFGKYGQRPESRSERYRVNQYPILEPITATVPEGFVVLNDCSAAISPDLIDRQSSTVRITSSGILNSGIKITLDDSVVGKTVRFSMIGRFNNPGAGAAQALTIQDGTGSTHLYALPEDQALIRPFAIIREIASSPVSVIIYAARDASVRTVDICSYKIEIIN